MKIQRVAEDLNYFPYCKPRTSGLSERLLNYIGVVTFQYRGVFQREVERGIESILSPNNHNILRYTFNEKDDNLLDKEIFFKKVVEDKSIIGLISNDLMLSDKTIAELYNHGISVVVINKTTDYGKCVIIDNELAIYKVIKKIISLGHTKIGFMCPEPSGKNIWYERLSGYKKALKESNIKYDIDLVEHDNILIMELSEIATKNLIKRVPDLTAIMYISDDSAVAGLKAIKELGLKVPDDISVIGFDDIEYDNYFDPSLSSVKQPAYEMGRKAAEVLLESIKENDQKNKIYQFDTELIIRDSFKSLK